MLQSGIDIVEVKRIEGLFSQDEDLIREIFTLTEIDYCQGKRYRFRHFAARFAAKEAMMKALGTGWAGEIKWMDIEVTNDSSGKPYVNLHGRVKELVSKMGVQSISVSLSHCSDYAVAQVIMLSM